MKWGDFRFLILDSKPERLTKRQMSASSAAKASGLAHAD
jgi:hypothetical protein